MNKPRIEALISSRALRRIVTRVEAKSAYYPVTTLRREGERTGVRMSFPIALEG